MYIFEMHLQVLSSIVWQKCDSSLETLWTQGKTASSSDSSVQ